MIVLTERQIKLAEQLLISVIKKEPVVVYSELAERISPPMYRRQVGKDIGEISKLCHQLGLPLLSAKVVNKQSQNVGIGFFELCKEIGIDVSKCPERELLKNELKKIRECTEWYKLSSYLNLDLHFESELSEVFPDEISPKEEKQLHEGAKKQVNINAYERNSEARKICIKKHGCRCIVCGIDFGEVYGDLGKGFIHVHHIVPLHNIKSDYIVNAETDLIPVCPNCHAMLHKTINGRNLSVTELKTIIDKNKR